MTNRQPIPTDALLVAIDIAKVRNGPGIFINYLIKDIIR